MTLFGERYRILISLRRGTFLHSSAKVQGLHGENDNKTQRSKKEDY